MNAKAELSSTLLPSRQQAATAKTHRGVWLTLFAVSHGKATGLVICTYALLLSRQ